MYSVTIHPSNLARLAGRTLLLACLLAAPLYAAAPTALPGEEPLLLERPSLTEELPPPAAVIEELQADLRRLEKEVEALRTLKPEPPDNVADTTGGMLADRLADVEKGLGRLFDSNDKQRKKDARKPSLILSGQAAADQVYFGQDVVSRESVGDL